MTELLLTIAFFPLAVVAARLIFPTLKPKRHRPVLFFFLGALVFLFGILGGYALRFFLQSGVVRFTSRRLGEIYANASQQPLEYWVVFLILYGSVIFISGLGLAGLVFPFSKCTNNEP